LVGSGSDAIFSSVEEAEAAGYSVSFMDHAIFGNIGYLNFDPLAFNDWVAKAQNDATATDAQKASSTALVRQINNSYEINEETTAFYAEATKFFTVGGRDLAVVVGGRYEET